MHAIQTSRQLRPQHHDRSTSPASPRDEIVDPRPWCELMRQWSTLHPGVRVPAAQVQDRRQRRDRRPRRDPRPRHRPAAGARRRRRDRLPGARRRRPGPHADHRPRHPRVPAVARDPQLHRRDPARLQPLRPPRQQVQGAHQDPGEGARRRPSSRGRSKPSGHTCAAARHDAATRRSRASPRISRARLSRLRAATSVALPRRRSPTAAPFARWVERNVHAHQAPGYAIVTLSLKRTGVPPGDATAEQMDAIADARRPLQRSASCACRTSRT